MGLDCWVAAHPYGAGELTAGQAAVFARLDLPLCEWTVHNGFVHLAGKPYLDIVAQVTGVSLGEPWLAPETLAAMAERLAAVQPQATVDAFNAASGQGSRGPLTTDEFSALRVLFATCATHGLGLSNDW